MGNKQWKWATTRYGHMYKRMKRKRKQKHTLNKQTDPKMFSSQTIECVCLCYTPELFEVFKMFGNSCEKHVELNIDNRYTRAHTNRAQTEHIKGSYLWQVRPKGCALCTILCSVHTLIYLQLEIYYIFIVFLCLLCVRQNGTKIRKCVRLSNVWKMAKFIRFLELSLK